MQRDKTDAPFLAGGAEGGFPASPFPFVIVDKDLFRTGEVGNVQCALLVGKTRQHYGTVKEGRHSFIIGQGACLYCFRQQDAHHIPVLPGAVQRDKRDGVAAAPDFFAVYQNLCFACNPPGDADLEGHFHRLCRFNFQTGNQTVRLGRILAGVLQYGLFFRGGACKVGTACERILFLQQGDRSILYAKGNLAVTVLADVERIPRLVVESSVESGVGLHKRAVTAEEIAFLA